ncbi:type III secretion apparatus protein OrgA/MxiK [Salmonella enterica]|nr:type III secretion apparatus protein OrgA/MxiK [Salmonella enterica subsp. enterica serovar Freetown]EBN9932867.1 type III secretion apparatus protein OrgA/MxiK [Salmonella enterica]EBH8792743.1 type III secretion apparatus protein OrgA/MxiK [Salmonella enterica subsp. enterica serovar Freetown]EBP0843368.1 type III secretion apparatus protein OrgA/MxiK [Salmonella enterica]EJS3009955.1 type III secretion apparatus protein OrgA/MxiK [Salmonella enterica]
MSSFSLSTALQRVTFDPLSYIHQQRIDIPDNLIKQPAQRAVVNELIIKSMQLDIQPDDVSLIKGPLVQQVLCHWDLLVQVAFLLGCSYRRGELAWQGKLLSLPEWARHFLLMNLPANELISKHERYYGGLLCTGYSLLMGSVKTLPSLLTQRIPLLFPPEAEHMLPSDVVEPLILTLAFQHAQRNPDKLFSTTSVGWCADKTGYHP